MPEIYITIAPEGVTQCDLAVDFEQYPEAKAFFDYLRPHIKALHWLATKYDLKKRRGRLINEN